MKEKIIVAIFVFILIVALIGIFFLALNPNAFPLGAGMLGLSGFSVTSISNNFGNVTNDTDFSQLNWIVTGIINGSGQSIVGTITPDQTKSMDLRGFQTKFPLTIEFAAFNESVLYQTTGAANPIYHYNLQKFDGLFYDALPCPPSTFKEYSESAYLLWKTKYCIVRAQTGVYSTINNPNIIFDGKITLTANGKVISQTITSADSSVQFKDGSALYATASWQGSLVTGQSPPSPSTYVGIHKNDAAYWNINLAQKSVDFTAANLITENALNAVPPNLTQIDIVKLIAYIPSGFVNLCANDGRNCSDMFNNMIATANSKEDALLNQQVDKFGDYSYSAQVSTSTQGSWKINLPTRILNPTITLFVRADWLGVKTPVGQGTLSNVRCPAITSGNELVIFSDVSVSSAGSFLTTATCNNATQTNNNKANVSSGTATFASYLNYSNVSNATLNCSVTLKNEIGTLLDTKTTNCLINAPAQCTENDYRETGLVRYKCTNGAWVEILRCTSGQELTFNNNTSDWYCKDLGVIAKCGNGVCEQGENATNCKADCEPAVCSLNSDCGKGQKCVAGVCQIDCSDRTSFPYDGIFTLGWAPQVTNTPTYFLWLIPTGASTTTTCVPVSNANLYILLAIIVIALIIAAIFLLRKKPKRRVKRRRR